MKSLSGFSLALDIYALDCPFFLCHRNIVDVIYTLKVSSQFTSLTLCLSDEISETAKVSS